MSRYKELLNQIQALQHEAQTVLKEEKSRYIAAVKQQMAELGVTLEDLAEKMKAARAKPKAKFRDPKTGATWSGVGRKPNWVVSALADGASLESLLIDAPTAGTAPVLSEEPAAKPVKPKAAPKKAVKAK